MKVLKAQQRITNLKATTIVATRLGVITRNCRNTSTNTEVSTTIKMGMKMKSEDVFVDFV